MPDRQVLGPIPYNRLCTMSCEVFKGNFQETLIRVDQTRQNEIRSSVDSLSGRKNRSCSPPVWPSIFH